MATSFYNPACGCWFLSKKQHHGAHTWLPYSREGFPSPTSGEVERWFWCSQWSQCPICKKSAMLIVDALPEVINLQRYYQPNNLGIGIALMIAATLIFVVIFYVVESLDDSDVDVLTYKSSWVIKANPFDRKIRIKGGGEPGISQSVAGSIVDRTGSRPGAGSNPARPHLKASAPSAFESRLMDALRTQVSKHLIERPDTIEVYGRILEGPGGAFFMIDSIRPDNELFREKVERILEREKVFVSRPTQASYTVLFVGGEEVREIGHR